MIMDCIFAGMLMLPGGDGFTILEPAEQKQTKDGRGNSFLLKLRWR